MIVAAILLAHSSLCSVPPISWPLRHHHPRQSSCGLDRRAKMLSLLLHCKNDLNVFNNIRALFSAFVSPNPLLSIPSSLFSPKQGGRGINMRPKSFSVSYSRYLQCSQQNTNSLHFFATPTLCFHHFMTLLRKNTRVGGVSTLLR